MKLWWTNVAIKTNILVPRKEKYVRWEVSVECMGDTVCSSFPDLRSLANHVTIVQTNLFQYLSRRWYKYE